ncbi:MAG: aldo/keto reductase [Cardiobacteriaceae bacterium]|nr:aldo/keto reductase [Cardiobacteriaceae bacterium]
MQECNKKAIELGINYFDTANIYTNGDSEEYLGKVLRELNIKRDEVVIETKVFFNEGKLSRKAIFAEIDKSLKRLNMDYVDIYMIHRFDYDHSMEETMHALHELVGMGKVRAIGASAMYAYQFHNLQEIAIRNNLTPFTVMQNHYNLIYREDERDLIPTCRQFNTAIAPYSPLASGHLARRDWDSSSQRSREDKVMRVKYDEFKEADLKVISRLAKVAEKLNYSMAEVALAWLFSKGVESPVFGAINTEHLQSAVKSLEIKLSDEDVQYLEELYMPHKVVGAILKGGPERIERK